MEFDFMLQVFDSDVL